jgi:hypothetical protein
VKKQLPKVLDLKIFCNHFAQNPGHLNHSGNKVNDVFRSPVRKKIELSR